MLTEKNLAQNEFIQLNVNSSRRAFAAIATKSTTSATAVFVLQIEGATGEFVTIGIVDGLSRNTVANETGPSKHGWAEIIGTNFVRVLRTDATGGNGTVGLSVVDA